MEICTEFGHEDPPNFDCDLIDKLVDFLTHQDDQVFEKTISELYTVPIQEDLRSLLKQRKQNSQFIIQ